ncbi:hypothetical protein AAFF_G00150810 [Aldrovandia affinis]|uniref:Uncharacterized protein n=1 Tax=Aldrovandia affinis TaxID=143900 RepID=A0AAD7W8Y2_9TELE|nr:hypothetical protein AAFF_G00150810 [Aldrovandia affinis]
MLAETGAGDAWLSLPAECTTPTDEEEDDENLAEHRCEGANCIASKRPLVHYAAMHGENLSEFLLLNLHSANVCSWWPPRLKRCTELTSHPEPFGSPSALACGLMPLAICTVRAAPPPPHRTGPFVLIVGPSDLPTPFASSVAHHFPALSEDSSLQTPPSLQLTKICPETTFNI